MKILCSTQMGYDATVLGQTMRAMARARRGHEVVFLAGSKLAPIVAQHGFRVREAPSDPALAPTFLAALGSAKDRARALLPRAEEPYLVVPGDTLTDLDDRALVEFHRAHGGPITVALSTRYRLEVGLADVDPGTARILAWPEKPEIDRPVSTAAYVIDAGVIDAIARFRPDEREVDLPAEVFPALLAAGAPIRGFLGDIAFWDIGRIDDHDRLTRAAAGSAADLLARHAVAWSAPDPRRGAGASH